MRERAPDCPDFSLARAARDAAACALAPLPIAVVGAALFHTDAVPLYQAGITTLTVLCIRFAHDAVHRPHGCFTEQEKEL